MMDYVRGLPIAGHAASGAWHSDLQKVEYATNQPTRPRRCTSPKSGACTPIGARGRGSRAAGAATASSSAAGVLWSRTRCDQARTIAAAPRQHAARASSTIRSGLGITGSYYALGRDVVRDIVPRSARACPPRLAGISGQRTRSVGRCTTGALRDGLKATGLVKCCARRRRGDPPASTSWTPANRRQRRSARKAGAPHRPTRRTRWVRHRAGVLDLRERSGYRRDRETGIVVGATGLFQRPDACGPASATTVRSSARSASLSIRVAAARQNREVVLFEGTVSCSISRNSDARQQGFRILICAMNDAGRPGF